MRLKVLRSLGEIGPNAFNAGPRLAELLHDPDAQLADAADSALWRIDPRRAAQAGSWKPFTSKQWSFSAMFPNQPEEKIATTFTPLGEVTIHSWTVMHGATGLTIAVSEYSEEQAKEIPPEEWFRRLKENPGPLGLNIVQDIRVEQTGLRGWEFVAESEVGDVWKRNFWVGTRLYQVQVAYNPKFGNLGAGKYFLDSFKIEVPEK